MIKQVTTDNRDHSTETMARTKREKRNCTQDRHRTDHYHHTQEITRTTITDLEDTDTDTEDHITITATEARVTDPSTTGTQDTATDTETRITTEDIAATRIGILHENTKRRT